MQSIHCEFPSELINTEIISRCVNAFGCRLVEGTFALSSLDRTQGMSPSFML